MTEASFVPETTRALLLAVCRDTGIDARDAVLLRHQTNAVYELPAASTVVKISRPDTAPGAALQAVQLVQWLTSEGFPTVRLRGDLEQPVLIAGCQATFWEHLPQPAGRPVGGHELGALLRQLHDLPAPPVALRSLDALAAIRCSLRAATILSEQERQILAERADSLEARQGELVYAAPHGLIHADPQERNALWSADRAVLADWDSAVRGPHEWDLVTIEVHYRRFGGRAAQYRDFCGAYGHDVRDWTGYDALRALRELRMITTNARKSRDGSPQAREVHARIAYLADGDESAPWAIL